MFPYDPAILAAVQMPPESVADVLRIMNTIDATCAAGDGLKWFNWLYLEVTQAVETRIQSGGFSDPPWLAELDVQFARLYFNALESSLSAQSASHCWQTLFDCRDQPLVTRIQFALAGINAHINHDLPQAIVNTCQVTKTAPQHGDTHYVDYTNLNTTLDSLIDTAKRTLLCRLLGDPLPPISHIEDVIGAWSVSAARQSAWQNSELLWHLQPAPSLAANLMNTLDGLTTVANKVLLAPVP
jgi:hypothetical protein